MCCMVYLKPLPQVSLKTIQRQSAAAVVVVSSAQATDIYFHVKQRRKYCLRFLLIVNEGKKKHLWGIGQHNFPKTKTKTRNEPKSFLIKFVTVEWSWGIPLLVPFSNISDSLRFVGNYNIAAHLTKVSKSSRESRNSFRLLIVAKILSAEKV